MNTHRWERKLFTDWAKVIDALELICTSTLEGSGEGLLHSVEILRGPLAGRAMALHIERRVDDIMWCVLLHPSR